MTDDEIYPEVAAAAKWWADVMSAPDVPQDNGDAPQSAFVSRRRLGVSLLGADERTVFERVLREALQAHVTRNGWERARADPSWGSYSRAVVVDYGPDVVLAAAAHVITRDDRRQQARVSFLWPIKTVMWINPGEVAVRHGYGAERVVIYGGQAMASARPAREET